MRLKAGVKLTSLRPQVLIGLRAIEREYDKRNTEVVITSGTDGKHSITSKHYAGMALDIRTRNLPDPQVDGPVIARAVSTALGPDFDVIFEGDHIHLEYDPKRPTE